MDVFRKLEFTSGQLLQTPMVEDICPTLVCGIGSSIIPGHLHYKDIPWGKDAARRWLLFKRCD